MALSCRLITGMDKLSQFARVNVEGLMFSTDICRWWKLHVPRKTNAGAKKGCTHFSLKGRRNRPPRYLAQRYTLELLALHSLQYPVLTTDISSLAPFPPLPTPLLSPPTTP